MTQCYWNDQCNCSDKTPVGQTCDEHQGINCSFYGGAVITEHRQINDTNTARLEAAIAAMDV